MPTYLHFELRSDPDSFFQVNRIRGEKIGSLTLLRHFDTENEHSLLSMQVASM